MNVHTDYSKPARTVPRVTRFVLPLMTRATVVESAMHRGSGLVSGRLFSPEDWVCECGFVNVSSLRGKNGEVVNMAVEGRLDFCCLQVTRWRGEDARKMGAYKLFWKDCEKGIHGVGMLVADRWIEKVLDVKCVYETLMVVRVIVGRSELNLLSVYAP